MRNKFLISLLSSLLDTLLNFQQILTTLIKSSVIFYIMLEVVKQNATK